MVYLCHGLCWIGVLFSAIFGVALVHATVLQTRTINHWEAELVTLDQQLQAAPTDQKIVEQMRTVDARIRFLWFHRIRQTGLCAGMLLLSMIVLIAGVKWTYVLRTEQPRPLPVTNPGQYMVKQAALGRTAVTGMALAAVVLLGVVIGQGQRLLSPEPVTMIAGAIDANATELAAEETNDTSVAASTPEPSELTVASRETFAKQWHRFRGYEGAGVVHANDIPTQWDGEKDANIAWKVPVPGVGFNSPIVWDNRIFCAAIQEDKLQVYCFDLANGQLLWTGDVPRNPESEGLDVMEDTGLAPCTMATDGHHAYVIFGTGDLGCFDFDGKLLWSKALGVPDSSYGYASSLDVYHNRVVVQFDQGADDDELSKLLVVEGATGKVVCDKVRPVANVWTSPIVARVGDQDQIIIVSDPWTMGYDASSYKELWRAECVYGDLAASPIVAGGMTYAIEPYSQMIALKLDGTGNVTDTHKCGRGKRAALTLPVL